MKDRYFIIDQETASFQISNHGILFAGYILLPEANIFGGFLVLFFVINLAVFNFEANKALRHLEEIFQADTFNH